MILDFAQKEIYPQWAANQLGIDREYFGQCTTLSFVHGPHQAVAVFSSFNGINCEITVAATSKWWMRKGTLQLLFKYAFEQLECKRLTGMVDETNDQVVQLLLKLGFKYEGRLRKFMKNGTDCIVLGLLPEDWRYK